MEKDLLATYLNDHLAGSVVAMELLERLAANAEGTQRQVELTTLRDAVAEDQALVKSLLETRSTHQSMVKQAGAWVMEKVTRAKLHLAEADDAALGEVEALEVLSLGIAGKRGLWEVLRTVLTPTEYPAAPWDSLIQRADDQRQQVEAWRLEAAQRAFAPAPAPAA